MKDFYTFEDRLVLSAWLKMMLTELPVLLMGHAQLHGFNGMDITYALNAFENMRVPKKKVLDYLWDAFNDEQLAGCTESEHDDSSKCHECEDCHCTSSVLQTEQHDRSIPDMSDEQVDAILHAAVKQHEAQHGKFRRKPITDDDLMYICINFGCPVSTEELRRRLAEMGIFEL